MDLEPEKIREEYGEHKFGQSCLLARRLIESGVTEPSHIGDLEICAHLARELSVFRSARDDVHVATAVQGDLDHHVRAGPEPVDRQRPTLGQLTAPQ